jgi:hypothetical protein
MKKSCILTEENKNGAQIFWFEHPDTEDRDFNRNYVKVFFNESDEQPFLRCHVSNVIEVPETEIKNRWGSLYASDEYFKSVSDKWKTV